VLTNTLSVPNTQHGRPAGDRSGVRRATPLSCAAVCSASSGWFSQPERVSCSVTKLCGTTEIESWRGNAKFRYRKMSKRKINIVGHYVALEQTAL